MNQRLGRGKRGAINPEPDAAVNGATKSHQGETIESKINWAERFALLAAIAGSFAAGFSGWQAWTASDTEERQLRPYMSISIKESDASITQDGGTVGIQPQMKVFGLTPAGGVDPMWELHIADYPMNDHFLYKYIKLHTFTTAALAPGEPEAMDKKTIQISKDDVSAIIAGTKIIYIDGTVIYYDSFSKARWSNFCFTTDFAKLKENTFERCPTHNTADWNRIPESGYRPHAEIPM
jgi:hypothetical protein